MMHIAVCSDELLEIMTNIVTFTSIINQYQPVCTIDFSFKLIDVCLKQTFSP